MSSYLCCFANCESQAHVSYLQPWWRDAIRVNPIRRRGEAAAPAWEASKANLLPKHHKSSTVKWLFLMPQRCPDINTHSVMYCLWNYQRAQFTSGIHLDQGESKEESRDVLEAPRQCWGVFVSIINQVCQVWDVQIYVDDSGSASDTDTKMGLNWHSSRNEHPVLQCSTFSSASLHHL